MAHFLFTLLERFVCFVPEFVLAKHYCLILSCFCLIKACFDLLPNHHTFYYCLGGVDILTTSVFDRPLFSQHVVILFHDLDICR